MGKEAKFLHPTGIAIAADGTLYVTDKFNHKIRKITPDGMVTTLAGSDYGYLDGPGTRAQFKYPNGIAIAPDGSLYVADTDNNRIRRVSTTGEVTTVAGGEIGYKDGVGETAQFWSPHGIAVSPDGSLLVADTGNHKIRKITFK
jgi:sugar lactone lactonase YvrE